MKKKTTLPARAPRTRFQTAVSGIRYVPTAMDAQFDPYAGGGATPAPPAARDLDAMERVPRIAVDPA